MNPEHHTPNGREHAPNPAPIDTNRPIEPRTRHEQRTLDRLHTDLGSAFQIYLDHHRGDTVIADVEEDFYNRYWGAFDTPDAFLDRFITQLGWATARDDLIDDWSIPPDALIWDRAALLKRLADDYDIRTIEGHTHVFIR